MFCQEAQVLYDPYRHRVCAGAAPYEIIAGTTKILKYRQLLITRQREENCLRVYTTVLKEQELLKLFPLLVAVKIIVVIISDQIDMARNG